MSTSSAVHRGIGVACRKAEDGEKELRMLKNVFLNEQ